MQQLIFLGLTVIFLGLLLVFAGIILGSPASGNADKAHLRGGAVILIGPIPIVLGTDRDSALAVMAVASLLLVLAWFFLKG